MGSIPTPGTGLWAVFHIRPRGFGEILDMKLAALGVVKLVTLMSAD